MNLDELRSQIDQVDGKILDLFGMRMALAKDVARVKSQTGRAIFDPEREQCKIDDVRRRAPQGLEDEASSSVNPMNSRRSSVRMSGRA